MNFLNRKGQEEAFMLSVFIVLIYIPSTDSQSKSCLQICLCFRFHVIKFDDKIEFVLIKSASRLIMSNSIRCQHVLLLSLALNQMKTDVGLYFRFCMLWNDLGFRWREEQRRRLSCKLSLNAFMQASLSATASEKSIKSCISYVQFFNMGSFQCCSLPQLYM